MAVLSLIYIIYSTFVFLDLLTSKEYSLKCYDVKYQIDYKHESWNFERKQCPIIAIRVKAYHCTLLEDTLTLNANLYYQSELPSQAWLRFVFYMFYWHIWGFHYYGTIALSTLLLSYKVDTKPGSFNIVFNGHYWVILVNSY